MDEDAVARQKRLQALSDDLMESLRGIVRDAPGLSPAEVEQIMVEELQSLGYTVTKDPSPRDPLDMS